MKQAKELEKIKRSEVVEQEKAKNRAEKEELARQREENKQAEKEKNREEKSQQKIEAQVFKQQEKEEEMRLKSAAKKQAKAEKEDLKRQSIHDGKQRRRAETAKAILEKWTEKSPQGVASPKILKDINMRSLISLQLLNNDKADFDSLVASIADTMGEDIDVISATILDIRQKS